MAVITPAQTIIVTDTDPALQRDYGNTIQGTISPLTQNAIIYVNTTSILNSFTNILGGASAGNSGEVQFAFAGGFAADSGLRYDNVSDSLSVGGAVLTNAILTDQILHANGDPWNFTTTNTAAGGNTTELQYNNAGNTAGISTVRYFNANGSFLLGSVSNVKMYGGQTGQSLIAVDDAGNLGFGAVTPAAAGTDTQIQFNSSNVLTGAANFTYNSSTQTVSANILTATSVTSNNITISVNTTTGNLTVNGTANVVGNLVAANLTANSNITANNISTTANASIGVLLTAPNITVSNTATVGNLAATNVTVTGNAAFSGANVSLGSVSNLKITGGVNGRILSTDGTGNLSWAVPATAPAGSNTQIQFNDAGVLSGNANLTYNKSTQTLTASKLSVTSQANLGSVGNIIITGGAKSSAVIGNPVVSGGVITSIPVTTNGSGYDLPPVITIIGPYTTAANVSAVLDSNTGAVLSILVTSGGTGYSAPTASIAAPGTKFLSTNGNGNLSWRENGTIGGGGTSPSPNGPNSSVQFNDNGTLAGSGALAFNKTTNILTVANGIVASGDISTTGNLSVAGSLSLGNLTVNANITTANLTASGNVALSGANVSLGSVDNLYVTGGTSGQVLSTDGVGNLSFITINQSSISNGNSSVSVAANANVTVDAGANSWIFGDDGRLTLPNDGVLAVDGDNLEVRGVDNFNVEVDGVVNIYTDASGTTYQWQFGDDGNLTLPSNTANINYANGSPYITVPTALINGNSNVTVVANANVNISSNGVANVLAVTSTGANITGTANISGNLSAGNIAATSMIANAVTSNNVIFGNATTTVSTMKWLGASTTSTSANQVIYTAASANITSVDFHITATGVTGSGNSRQVAKVLAVSIDSTTNFTEYGGMWVGANLGDFNVIQTGSNLELVVTPTTANTVQYNVILTTYY